MVEVLDEAALPPLLKRFYDRVHRDAELGPVFDEAVHDWPAHLQRLAAFWSSVMLTSGRYKGNPMLMHLKHGDIITASMFARWLAIWRETTDELLPASTASAMQAKAGRIAESLQIALSIQAGENRAAIFAHDPLSPHRATPIVVETTLATPSRPGLLDPEQPHRVEPPGPTRMQVASTANRLPRPQADPTPRQRSS